MTKIIFSTLVLLGMMLAVPAAHATSYYGANASTSPACNDSNNGTSPSTPWCSPNHALNCGDTITFVASSAYNSAQFTYGQWGAVTCPAANNVAWVACATFDGCKIQNQSDGGMWVTSSYWGVQGWEITVGATHTETPSCIYVSPTSGAEIHHIVIANNICNGAAGDGISSGPASSGFGVDYLAYLGNITYGTGGASTDCAAGISFYAPVAYDSLPGTHNYAAGNFSWGNTSNCGDGEGMIFDTFDTTSGQPVPYAQQSVAENNLLIWNDGPGLQVDLNDTGSGAGAPIYFSHNTVAYNQNGPSTATFCGEINEATTLNTQSTMNLVDAPTQYCFGGATYTHYGDLVAFSTANTIKVYQEFAYNANGNGVGETGSTGFTAGPNNTTSTNPSFVNPVQPGAPSCSAYATTTACMASVIAGFTPTNAAATHYGYQVPSATPDYDPLFPQWLCGVTNLPAGLVTRGCVTGSAMSGGSISGGTLGSVASILGLPEQWLMHEGSGDTFADATANDNTITASNITWGTGTGVTSPTFNGSNSTGVAAQTAITDFDGTKPFSVSVWVNVDNHGSQMVLAGILSSSTDNYTGWSFELNSATSPELYLINNYGSGNYIDIDGAPIDSGATYNLIVTYDGSQTAAGVAFYNNGVLQGFSINHDSLSSSTASGLPLAVGSRNDGTNPLNGSMSNLQIFSGVLTAGQIAAIQTAGP